MTEVYRIQNEEGLFSTGGTYPNWSKKGKLWANRSALSNHLGLLSKPATTYKNAKLITYELVETVIDAESIDSVLARKAENKAKRDEGDRKRWEAWRKEARKAEYEKLSKEFGGA